MFYIAFLLVLAVPLEALQGQTGQPALTLATPPVLSIDQNGSATATLLLDFKGQPAKLHLEVSEFRRTIQGKEYALRSTALLATVNPAHKPILEGAAEMLPGILPLKVTVNGVSESGVSQAVLMNDGQQIGKLTAVRVPAAYNVRLEAPEGRQPEVIVSSSRKPAMRLLNSDPTPHRFQWQVLVNGQEMPAGTGQNDVVVPANGSAMIDLSAAIPGSPGGPRTGFFARAKELPDEWLTSGTLKDRVTPSELILNPVFDGVAVAPQAAKVMQFSLRQRFWSDGLQEAMNIAFVFLLLCAGGVLAIWVNCGMPNTTRALAVRRRLRAAKARIAGLGNDIDSRWRVLLSAQRARLKSQLYQTFWVFPSFAAVLDSMLKELEMFESWVQCAYDASLIAQEHRQLRARGMPPTLSTLITEKCNQALEPIETGFTTQEEIQIMRAACLEARHLLSAVERGLPIPELEAAIKQREEKLAADKNDLMAYSIDFSGLIASAIGIAGQPITAPYFDRDFVSRRVELLNEYRRIEKRMTPAGAAQAAGAGPAPPATVPNALARLQAQSARFFDYLRGESLESIEAAELYFSEMRQDIYTGALLTEVQKVPPAISIVHQPALIELLVPVRLSLRFERPVLTNAAACLEWRCVWQFGDGGTEEGWSVYYTFTRPGTCSVTATLLDENGMILKTLGPKELTAISAAPDTQNILSRLWQWFAPETMLEASRLLLVLVVAVVGLLASAQQQIQNLTFLQAVAAVFALGFGAGTLKNMITEKASSDAK